MSEPQSELQLFHKPCIQFTNRGFCSNSGCPYNHTKRGNRRDCLGFQNGSCKKGSLCIYRHDESCYPNGSPILPPSDIKIASADRNNKRVIKPLSSPPEFECSECNAKLESRNKLFVHIQTNHQNHPTSKSGENIARRESKIFITDNLDLHIIQDYDIFRVICKPQGLPTMSGQGITVQNSPSQAMLLSPFANVVKGNERFKKVRPCHRLDSATGGLLICSKTREAGNENVLIFLKCKTYHVFQHVLVLLKFDEENHIKLSFRNRLVHKRYRSIVIGSVQLPDGQEYGEINFPVDGKKSKTIFKVVDITKSRRYENVTTLDLYPVTGRKHQLRKHLQAIGHPILGDKRYSHSSLWPPEVDELFLWALEVRFPSPSIPHADPSPIIPHAEAHVEAHENPHENKSASTTTNSSSSITIQKKSTEISIGEDIEEEYEDDDDDNFDRDQMEITNGNDKLPFIVKADGDTAASYIAVSIDEPAYYDQFRKLQLQESEEYTENPIEETKQGNGDK